MVGPRTPRLSVRDLTVRYGDHVAVDSVDLDVHQHEVVALLGPSGCGKSSLLRAVAGLEPCTGSVRIDGVDVTRERPDRRHLGLMFQGHALFPHADVAGNVGFGLRMQGWDRERIGQRVDEVLDLVRLPGARARQIDTLSGGEQQRVALARAVAPDPRVLMLDEPLSSIDRALRDRLLEDLPVVFSRIGAAVLHVTHDQEEALAVADRVVVLRAGRVEQAGPSLEVWNAPANGWVAGFVGQRNLVEVAVRDGVADTPFGAVTAGELPDGPGTLWLPTAAIERVPDDGTTTGDVRAIVRSRRFTGDHVMLTITTEGGVELELRVPASADAPGIDDRVHVRVDRSRLQVLPTG